MIFTQKRVCLVYLLLFFHHNPPAEARTTFQNQQNMMMIIINHIQIVNEKKTHTHTVQGPGEGGNEQGGSAFVAAPAAALGLPGLPPQNPATQASMNGWMDGWVDG